MATPGSTCCTQQLKNRQLISIFSKKIVKDRCGVQYESERDFKKNQRGASKGDREAPDAIGTAVYCVLSGLSSSREYHALVRSFGLNSCQISMSPRPPDLYCSQYTIHPLKIISQGYHVSYLQLYKSGSEEEMMKQKWKSYQATAYRVHQQNDCAPNSFYPSLLLAVKIASIPFPY